MICTKCRTLNPADHAFCGHCGKVLMAPVPKPIPVPIQVLAQPEVHANLKAKIRSLFREYCVEHYMVGKEIPDLSITTVEIDPLTLASVATILIQHVGSSPTQRVLKGSVNPKALPGLLKQGAAVYQIWKHDTFTVVPACISFLSTASPVKGKFRI